MKIYLCSIAEFLDLPFMDSVSKKREDKINRYLFLEDKARSLVAGLLLRYALGDKYEEICVSEYGKSYLPNEDLFFNISHSGDYVAMAVGTKEVGIDIEHHAPVDKRIIKKVFTEDEILWLDRQNDMNAFYRLWTGKESFMKMIGLGFSLPPDSFSIGVPSDGMHDIKNTRCSMRWYELKDYSLCVSSMNENDAYPELITKKTIEEFLKK